MDNKAVAQVPVNNKLTSPSTPNRGFFDFLVFPFFGPSIICIIIIGGPRTFSRFGKFVRKQMNTQLQKGGELKGIGSGVSGKPLMIPVAYASINGLLSTFRGVDDNVNIISAGTITGLLYKASTGNIISCGIGGLTGLLLSSLYCSLKPHTAVELEKEHDYDDMADDYWKPK